MDVKRLLKDIAIVLLLFFVLIVNVINLEQFYFVVIFLMVISVSIYKMICGSKKMIFVPVVVVSLCTLILLLINFNYYKVWYESDSIYTTCAKIVVNILIALVLYYVVTYPTNDKDIKPRTNLANKVIVYGEILFCVFFCALYSAASLHFSVRGISDITLKSYMFDVMFCLMLIVVLWLVVGYLKIASAITVFLAFLFSVVNHFVDEFHGAPIIYNEIKAANTAKNVVSGYHINFTGEVTIITVGIALVLIVHLLLQKPNIKIPFSIKWIVVRVSGVVVLTISFIQLTKVHFDNPEEVFHLSRIAWDPMVGYNDDGVIKTIAMTRNCTVLHKPSGYSVESMREAVNCYKEPNYDLVKDDNKPKNIIVIMNESWSDLSEVHELKTNIEYNSFYKNLDGNVIKGTALSSVWGGGTCNSEYEFLFGNSMWYTPGTYPYQTFIDDDVPTLVSTLSAQGYHTMSIHPCEKTNWNRAEVYDKVGFDESYYDEVLEDASTEYLMSRSFISDAGLYKYIENYIDKSEYEYNFVFVVTIQNHGGYQYSDYQSEVECENVDSEELDQYLGIMKETDDALEQLISYYEDKESTVILMFGDHQPAFIDSKMQDYTEQAKKSDDLEVQESVYKVPYLIWKNYGEGQTQYRDTSLNFLSTNMLEFTGLKMPSYNYFLADLQKDIQAMNLVGCQDVQGDYHYYNEVDEVLEERFKIYKMFMYNQLMGGDSLDKEIFYIQ